MSEFRRVGVVVALALQLAVAGCGGNSPEEEAEQAAIRFADAWTDEDTKRLCQLSSKAFTGHTDAPCENQWVSVLAEQKRLARAPAVLRPWDAKEWKLPSPEVTRSHMSEDSARAKVEVTGSTGRVLVLYMSETADSWLVDKFDYTWVD